MYQYLYLILNRCGQSGQGHFGHFHFRSASVAHYNNKYIYLLIIVAFSVCPKSILTNDHFDHFDHLTTPAARRFSEPSAAEGIGTKQGRAYFTRYLLSILIR